MGSRRSPSWLTSTDSKVIGRSFIGCSLLALPAPRSSACSSASSGSTAPTPLFDAGALPQLFVAFRVGLVFGALVPLLLGLAIAVVPLQLGARSLAFPASPRPASGPGSAGSSW